MKLKLPMRCTERACLVSTIVVACAFFLAPRGASCRELSIKEDFVASVSHLPVLHTLAMHNGIHHDSKSDRRLQTQAAASPSPPPPANKSQPNAAAPSSMSPAMAPQPAAKNNPSHLPAIIGATTAAVALMAAGIALGLWNMHRQQQRRLLEEENEMKQPRLQVCEQFSLQLLQEATNDWAEDCQVGSGAFGDVYGGVDPRDGQTLWAVKRARLLSNSFQKEVEAIAALNHPNLVRLVGYCIDISTLTRTMEQVVVYEFVANGDLAGRLDKDPPLTLEQRLTVLLGAARGLEYLHSFGIVHRDVKTSNILLDEQYRAKIADFGLVRISDGSSVGLTQVVGTPGYVDPAYVRTKIAAPSADVYSFGIVMLQLLCNRKATTEGGHIREWMEPLMKSGDLTSFMDPSLSDCPDDIIRQLAELGLRCGAMPTVVRPRMSDVVSELEGIRLVLTGKQVGDKRAGLIDEKLQKGDNSESLEEEFANLKLKTPPDSPVHE